MQSESRKTPLTISISMDRLDGIEKMRAKKIVLSHFIDDALKAYEENGFELPITIKSKRKSDPVI
jgi:hypothetical protein